MGLMDVEKIRKNKTGALMAFSVPAIISMILVSVITVVDGYFMGNYIDKDAIAAVNIGLPITYLFLGFGLMIGVGGSVIGTISLGKKDYGACSEIFSQTMIVAFIFSIILSAICFFFFTPMLAILHAEGNLAAYFRQYYVVMLLELPFILVNSSFGMFMRNEGRPGFYMNVTALTVIINIVLDYVFTLHAGFGVRGIAFASFISAFAATLIFVFYFLKKSNVFRFVRFRFSKKTFRDTMLNGSSEFIGEMSMCISMFCYNYVIMKRVGCDGVTSFTVVGYTAYVFSMIVIGFGQGASGIISFLFGSGEKKLACEIRKLTNAFVFAFGVLTVICMTVFGSAYSRFFVDDDGVCRMIREGMLIFMMNFLISGFNAISSFYFTAIGKAKESAVISASRGLVVLLASIFILPIFFGMNGIWLTSPVTEALTSILTVKYIMEDKRSIKKDGC